MPASGPVLRRHLASELSLAQARAVAGVINRAFPDPDSSVEGHVRWLLESRDDKPLEMFAVWDGEVAIASASFFPRDIATETGTLRVLALAAVCSDPARRGEGWGRSLVRAVFTEVGGAQWPVTLFQTSVPGFYAKLGARTVANDFVNSGTPDPCPGRGTREQPWWDPHIMIYPADFPWPSGTIDLRGPGY